MPLLPSRTAGQLRALLSDDLFSSSVPSLKHACAQNSCTSATGDDNKNSAPPKDTATAEADVQTHLHGAVPAEVSVRVGVDRGVVVLRDFQGRVREVILDLPVSHVRAWGGEKSARGGTSRGLDQKAQ